MSVKRLNLITHHIVKKSVIILVFFITVCEAPCITCPPFDQTTCGIGRAPAVEHDKWTFTPAVNGWFNPWMWIYNGGTENRIDMTLIIIGSRLCAITLNDYQ